MRRTFLSFVAIIAVGLLAGCGAPSWVQHDAGVRKGQASLGVYGVGKGASELEREAQVDFASIRARTVVDKAEKQYLASMLQKFVQSHADWFKVKQVKKMGLYEKAADQIAEQTLLNTQMVDQWTDAKGSTGEAGTVYVLRYLPLDSDFFDTVLKSYKQIIQENAGKILKAEPDTVMKGLTKCVLRMQTDPFLKQKVEKENKKKKQQAAEPKSESPKKSKKDGSSK